MDKAKLLHTKGVEQLKSRVPNLSTLQRTERANASHLKGDTELVDTVEITTEIRGLCE